MDRTMEYRSGLDGMVMLRAVVAPLLFWGALVGGAAGAGYPGAACMTPLAWLLGCWIGTFVGRRSRSPFNRRILEAFLAGALLGLFEGIIFYVLQRTMMPVRPDEQSKAMILSMSIMLAGTVVCALLALATSAMMVRRLRRL